MKIKFLLLFTSVFLALYSCGASDHKIPEKQLMSLFVTPDSLLIKEEIALKYKFGDLMFEKTSVVNNNFVLNATKEDFIRIGLTENDFRKINKEFNDFNRINDTINTPIDVSTMLQESLEIYLQAKQSLKK